MYRKQVGVSKLFVLTLLEITIVGVSLRQHMNTMCSSNEEQYIASKAGDGRGGRTGGRLRFYLFRQKGIVPGARCLLSDIL